LKIRPLSELKRGEFHVRINPEPVVIAKKLTPEEEKTRVEEAKLLVKKFNKEKKEREKEKAKHDEVKKKKMQDEELIEK